MSESLHVTGAGL